MREEYKNTCRRINLLQDRFSQFKRHEIAQMGELSYQLFDTKIYKHQVNTLMHINSKNYIRNIPVILNSTYTNLVNASC